MRDTSQNIKRPPYNHSKTRYGVCIVTNGECTEINYLHSLLNHYKTDYDVRKIASIKESNPRTLIDKAIRLSNECGAKNTWVVLDSDSATFVDKEKGSKNLQEAQKYAGKKGVRLALSCMSFEVWLIAHYTNIPIHDSLKQIISSLDKYIKSCGSKTKYSKNNQNMINKYFINLVSEATNHAKESHQKLNKDFELDGSRGYLWDFGNFTTVYELIEFLQI